MRITGSKNLKSAKNSRCNENLNVGGVLMLAAIFATGCSSSYSRGSNVAESLPAIQQPSQPERLPQGVALHVWEEPMVDVIDVPAGLDPEGYYYRPAHKEVVEIRQGRWRHYREDMQGDDY